MSCPAVKWAAGWCRCRPPRASQRRPRLPAPRSVPAGGVGREGAKLARQPLPQRRQLGHLPLQRAQHRAHLRPDYLRLGPQALDDPADELIGVKRPAGQRASRHRRLELLGQPSAQLRQVVAAQPLGQGHRRRRPQHPLGRVPVQGSRRLYLLQQLGGVHASSPIRPDQPLIAGIARQPPGQTSQAGSLPRPSAGDLWRLSVCAPMGPTAYRSSSSLSLVRLAPTASRTRGT